MPLVVKNGVLIGVFALFVDGFDKDALLNN